jgi:hypothetical protein
MTEFIAFLIGYFLGGFFTFILMISIFIASRSDKE